MEKEILNYESLPDRIFVPAIKVRDIVRARPMSIQEKRDRAENKRGGADIIIMPVIGEPYLITRGELKEYFRYTNDREINPRGWKASKQYIVYKEDETEIRVLQIPTTTIINIGKRKVNSTNRKNGEYIVCLLDENGQIDRAHPYIVNSAIFKKLCYIPMNETIEKHIGNKSRHFSLRKLVDRYSNTNRMDSQSGFSDDTAEALSNINIKKNQQKFKENTVKKPVKLYGETFKTQLIPKGNPVRQEIKYTIISQIHDEFGKRIGFIIQAPNGDTRKITKDKAIELGIKKKLINAEVVQESGRETYLRGNNYKLDELPIDYK